MSVFPLFGARAGNEPLRGVRIADLAGAWAGSFATLILGDLGAEVIKIEALQRPDVWRGMAVARLNPGEPGVRPYNRTPLIASVNRNKAGITLDLGRPEGRELFLQLVATSDIVAENYTPRVMPNFGLGFEALARVRPSLIMLAMPAYGDVGPYSDFAGIGGTVEPLSGNSALLGDREGKPLNSGDMYPDAVAGLFGASAVVTALYARERGAGAQYINLAQMETMISLLGGVMVEAGLQGVVPRRDDCDPDVVPSGHFRCRDGGWLAVRVATTGDWERFTSAIGRPDLAGDPELRSVAGRVARRFEVDGAVAAWCSCIDVADAEEALLLCGLDAARVQTMAGVAKSPHLAARDFFQSLPHDELGTVTGPGLPWRMSATPASLRSGPPLLGEHSEQVLRDLLGLSQERIADLVASAVTGTELPDLTANGTRRASI